ncbi:MAG: diguanylate cyclase [Elusimicrobiota bacterium]|jgi:diguanylate cyclase (GGDEF)-like protein
MLAPALRRLLPPLLGALLAPGFVCAQPRETAPVKIVVEAVPSVNPAATAGSLNLTPSVPGLSNLPAVVPQAASFSQAAPAVKAGVSAENAAARTHGAALPALPSNPAVVPAKVGSANVLIAPAKGPPGEGGAPTASSQLEEKGRSALELQQTLGVEGDAAGEDAGAAASAAFDSMRVRSSELSSPAGGKEGGADAVSAAPKGKRVTALKPAAGTGLGTMLEAGAREGRVDRVTLEALKKAAFTDALTGVPNRVFLDEQKDRLARENRTLITFKLDWLKEINDAEGHAAGDFYLGETARIAARVLGDDGLIVRRSPTGFAVFTRLRGREAELLADALRIAVAYHLAGRRTAVADLKTKAPIQSTINLGMAPIPSGTGAFHRALEASELSREAAKTAGGDLVADASGKVLPRSTVYALRVGLRAAGLSGLLSRFESELSHNPLDRIPRRDGSGPSAAELLARIKDEVLRAKIEAFLYKNALSGLSNRRWLDENVDRLVSKGLIVEYAALDLDKFGDVNRSLGEEKADRVLVRFGELLAEAVAGHDAYALHLSGEEFAILVGPKETDLRGLLDGARVRVQNELGRRVLERDGVRAADGQVLRITVSAGTARIHAGKTGALPAVLEAGERAETSLQKAKTSGRNRVVLESD